MRVLTFSRGERRISDENRTGPALAWRLNLVNEYKRLALEDRLLILNILESLLILAPNARFFEESLGNLGPGMSVNSIIAHLGTIEQSGIATFILPESLTEWTALEAPVRIKEIDVE